jgi:membrane-associated phospholipid phosphatase
VRPPTLGADALPTGPLLLYASGALAFALLGPYGPAVKALLAAPFLVAMIAGRLGAFVRDWAVFLAGVVLFDSLRAGIFVAVQRLELPLHMGDVIRLERAWLGGATLPTRLQPLLLGPRAPAALAPGLVVVHASHFVSFLLFGLGLWLLRREAFGRFAAAMLLLMGLGLAGHLLAPTVPPWMAAELGALPPLHRVADDVYGRAAPGLRKTFDTNPVAAMPSLHAAFPALVALVAFRHLGTRAWPLAAYVALVGLAAGALGEHYLLDVVAGVALATCAYAAVYRRREAGPARDAAAATGAAGRRLLLGTALFLLAAGVSQAALHARRPFALPEEFVRRELGGRAVPVPVCPRC